MEKDRKEKGIKCPGGFEQNVLGRLPRRCSDTAPLPEMIPLDLFVRACRAVVAWRRRPPLAELLLLSPYLPRSLSISRSRRTTETLARRAPQIAVAMELPEPS